MTGTDIRDVVVVGSGPAGYTAALYLARADLRPLVFEGMALGGALMTTTEVENYPGFRDPVQGPVLMDEMRAQAERFGAELIPLDITSVDLSGGLKTVQDDSGQVHSARSVVLAMGSAYRKLGLEHEDRLTGRGLSWCATCDAFFFKGQDVAVVGGGDSAMEEALFLARFATSVTVVHRRDTLRASSIMRERASAEPKIRFVWDSEVDELHGSDRLEWITLRDRTGAQRRLDVTGLFVAVGHLPRSELVAGQVDIDADGYVQVASPSTRTSLDGVFACGDLVDRHYQQAITAAGSGCAAALDAERHLARLAHEHSLAASSVEARA